MSRVILMEEDEPLRGLLAEWLTAAGYCVREATLRQMEIEGEGDDAVDLVLIDLPQLRVRGAERVAQVRAAQRHAALLGLSTQLRESPLPSSALAEELGLQRLLAKPCSRPELLAAVAEVLARERAKRAH